MTTEPINRRQVLLASLSLGTAVLKPVADGKEIAGEMPWTRGETDAPTDHVTSHDYVFFTPVEIQFIEAAVDRMIPADHLGPGGVQAGVPIFIDRQLAGEFGKATNWYMQGPWPKGTASQGLQGRRTPAERYRAAIKAIGDYLQTQQRKPFHQLSAHEQDQLLSQMETGTVQLADDVDGKDFFTMFLQNVMEGFFSDPLYGGNRDMAGWKLIGFPGARYDHRDFVGRHGEPYSLPPVSLRGRPAWKQS